MNKYNAISGYNFDGYYFDFIPKEKTSVTGRITEIGKLKSIVKLYLQSNIKGQEILNHSPNFLIKVNDNAIGKWFSKPMGENKLRALTAIDDIIKVAVKIDEQPGSTNGVKKVHYFVSLVSVKKHTYPFLFQVHELQQGEFIYHVVFINHKKRPTSILAGLLNSYRGLKVDTELVEFSKGINGTIDGIDFTKRPLYVSTEANITKNQQRNNAISGVDEIIKIVKGCDLLY